jgi:hypothetical protein
MRRCNCPALKLSTTNFYHFDPVGEDFTLRWYFGVTGKMYRTGRHTGTSSNRIKIPARPAAERLLRSETQMSSRVDVFGVVDMICDVASTNNSSHHRHAIFMSVMNDGASCVLSLSLLDYSAPVTMIPDAPPSFPRPPAVCTAQTASCAARSVTSPKLPAGRSLLSRRPENPHLQSVFEISPLVTYL